MQTVSVTLSDSLLSFAVVAALVAITPGVDTALVVRTAARHGSRAALAITLGVCTGVLVWALLAAVGVGALLAASPTAFAVLRVVGALYMAWLGARMLAAAVRGTSSTYVSEEGAAPAQTGASFRQGAIVNLTNPKVAAFYLAMVAQFLPPGEPPILVGVLFGLIHGAATLAWFGFLTLMIERLRRFLRSQRAARTIDGVVGLLLLALAVLLLLGD